MMSRVWEQAFSFLQMQSWEEGSSIAQGKTIPFSSCHLSYRLGTEWQAKADNVQGRSIDSGESFHSS